ncbi:MAG: RHS repeat protein, partial [Bacilli bacterium]|nr:RHS repeat protein [Bacilli bacterium]
KVNIDYAPSSSYSFLQIEETGILEINHTNMHNRETYNTSQRLKPVINNLGIAIIDYLNLTSNGARTSIRNDAIIQMTNSNLVHDLDIANGKSNVVIKDSVIKGEFKTNFSETDNNTFKQIINNTDVNGNVKPILLYGSPLANVILYKNNIYEIVSTITVPENVVVEMEAGATLKNQSSSQNIIINGTLKLNGMEEQKVNIDYAPSSSYSFLQIGELGRLEMIHTNMYNRATYNTSQRLKPAIHNLGTAIIDYLSLTSAGSYSDVESNGNIQLTNSYLPHSLIIEKNSKNTVIRNNILAYQFTLHLEACDINTFSTITDNYTKDNQLVTIRLRGNLLRSVRLPKNSYSILNELIVPENVEFIVEAGSDILWESGYSFYRDCITIKGSAKFLGTEEEKINLRYGMSYQENKQFYIYPEGRLEMHYTNLINSGTSSNGNPKSYAIYNLGDLQANNIYLKSNGATHDIKNEGNIDLLNSTIYASVIIADGSTIQNIGNNKISGYFSIYLEGCDLKTFDHIHTNYQMDGSIKDIFLRGSLVRSVRLPKQFYTRREKLIIPEGLEFILEQGATLQLDSSIEVAGTLKLFGVEDEMVNISYAATTDQFRVIDVLKTGFMYANYATIHNIYSSSLNGSREIYAIYNSGNLIATQLQVTTAKPSSAIKNCGEIDLTNSYIQASLYIVPGSTIIRIQDNMFSRFYIDLEGCNLENLKNILNNYDINKKEIVIDLYGILVRNVRLPKHKYEMNSKLVVPDNIQLILDAGSVLNMEYQLIEINGIMKLFGTEEQNIVINYDRWEDTFITIGGNGKLEANYTTLHNVDGWSATKGTIEAIYNQGTLILQHSQFLSNDVICNVRNIGTLNAKNSKFHNSVYLNDGSYDINIDDSIVGSSIIINSVLNGSVSINRNASTSYQRNAVVIPFQYITPNLLENMKDNYNSRDNLYSGIGLTGNITKSVKLPSQKYMLWNTVEIDENSILEVEPGAFLKTRSSGIQITINGTLNLRGSLNNPIKFTDLHEGTSKNDEWRGIVINPSGTAIINNTEFIRIGYNSGTYAINNMGQLIMWNSILNVARGNGIRYNTNNLEQLLVNNSINGSITSNIIIKAPYNYWGSEKGPKFKNPYTGSYEGGIYTVSDNIQFYPYNTTFVKNDESSLELIKTIVYDAPHFGKVGVNSFNGNYSKQYIDFELLNNLNITRTYNSKSTKESILGYGWSFSYDSYVEKHPYGDNSYLVHLPDSSINIFMKQEEQYVSLNSRNTFQIVNEKYVLTTKEQIIYTYGKNGKLESITDKCGNKTILTYTNNLLTSITDSNHRTYTLEYQNGLLIKVIDPMNRTTEYYYKDNLLSKVVDTNGIETAYSYNGTKQLIHVKENNNVMLTLEYITEGIYKDYILKLTNEKGLTITYEYDSSSNMTTETDSNGRITKKYYDRDGYVYKEINPNENTKTTAYQLENGTNKYGEVAFIVDINSAKTTYTRDEKGNIIKVTNPDSSIKQYIYNSKNQVIKEIDEVGSITEYIYDTDEITLLKQVKPLDGKTIYSEEADQNNFEIISYIYYEPSEVNNIKGLIKTKTDEKGTTAYTYNDNGDIISIMNANNVETVYTKNKLGWTLTEQVEDGYITEYEYDKNGNVTSIRKDSKLISKTEYNYQNKPIKVMDGNCKEITLITNVRKSLNWNSNQNLLSTSDNSTICDAITYEYDISGNKIKETDREGNVTTYQYDYYGNVIRKNLPNDSSYIYEYDNLNRLAKTFFKEGEETTLLEEKTYTVASTSTVTTKTYTNDTDFKTMVESYNNRGFKTIEKLETNSATTNYYKNGQVSSTVDRNGAYTYYYYDKVNRLNKKCVQANSYYICTLYTYDNFGRLIEEKVGKNTVSSSGTPSSYVITTYEYDNIGQVIKKTTLSGEEIEYTYDIYGNVLTQKTKISEDKYQTKTYEYNDLNKVTKENLEGFITTYEYDGIGNLIKKTTGENVVTEYQYNKNYQLTKTILDNITQEMISYDNMGNVIEKTDPNGNVTKYSYDKRNNVIKETSPKNFITTHSYDSNNRLIKTKEQDKTTVYSYDKFDNVISKTINDTIIYQYTYDKNNNVLKEIDPLGNSVTYAYDKLNRIVQVTDKLGNYKTYSYDTLSNIVTERNEKSIYTYSIYDERGNVKEKKVGSLVIEQNEYDLMNNLTKKKDANNNITTYEYNTLNQLVKKTNPLGYIEEFEYDKNGNVVKIKTNDKVILYSYDNRGNLLKTVEQTTDGKQKIETSKVYDNNNNVIKEIDGNGNITVHTYDSLNHLIKTKNPLNQETTYEYDNNNNLVKETNYLGDSKVYVYDSFDRVIEKKNELNETIEKLEYDLNGRQIKSIDGLGHTTIFVYDKLDRVIEKIDPLNRSEKTTYDALGNVLTKTDPNGNITRYEYNNFNKVTKITNALNEVTIYTYDNNNNLLTVTDGNNKKTIYTYNVLNLELTEKDPLGNIETKEYNSNGTLKKKTTKNGSEILYSYDIHDRLIKENDIVYKYDNNNNLLEIKENENVITRTYDKLNRVVSKTENGFTTTFMYSDYTETSIDPKGNETIKKFDKTGRLKEVVGNANYSYHLDGTVSKVTYQNGSIEEYTYKDDKSLDTLVNTYGDNKETYQYQYDNNKNIISKYENGKETGYTYDALNRLKTISEITYQETENEELERVETLLTTYLYDKAGNRTKEVSGTVTKEYTYDSNNKLTKVVEKENNVITKTTDYTYDKNGNSITETVNNEVKVTNTY